MTFLEACDKCLLDRFVGTVCSQGMGCNAIPLSLAPGRSGRPGQFVVDEDAEEPLVASVCIEFGELLTQSFCVTWVKGSGNSFFLVRPALRNDSTSNRGTFAWTGMT